MTTWETAATIPLEKLSPRDQSAVRAVPALLAAQLRVSETWSRSDEFSKDPSAMVPAAPFAVARCQERIRREKG